MTDIEVSTTPNIKAGRLVFAGTRLQVIALASFILDNATTEEIMAEYPSVTEAQVMAVAGLVGDILEQLGEASVPDDPCVEPPPPEPCEE